MDEIVLMEKDSKCFCHKSDCSLIWKPFLSSQYSSPFQPANAGLRHVQRTATQVQAAMNKLGNTSFVWCLSQASDHQQFLLAGKPFCYVICACYRMISYDQAEIGLWTGSLVGERAKKTKGENKQRDGEGSTLHSFRLLIYFFAFPLCRACLQAKLSGSHHQNDDDDFRSGCRNFSQGHLKQSFSGLHSPGRSQFTELWYDSWVESIYSSFVLYTVKHSLSYPTHIFDFIYQNYRIIVTRFVDYYEPLYLAKKKIM